MQGVLNRPESGTRLPELRERLESLSPGELRLHPGRKLKGDLDCARKRWKLGRWWVAYLAGQGCIHFEPWIRVPIGEGGSNSAALVHSFLGIA